MILNLLGRLLIIYEDKIRVRLGMLTGRILATTIKKKGANLILLGFSRFLFRDKLWIGKNVRIGENCYFYCRGGLKIGDNTIISRNVVIYTASHNYKGEKLPFDDTYITKKVIIGKNVWIGMNVNILPGVEIGEGAIIGLGATITKNVKSGEIVGNVPFRVLSMRDMLKYKRITRDV